MHLLFGLLLGALVIAALTAAPAPSPVAAQVAPDHDPAGEPVEWPYVLPFFGRQLAERGIRVPLPGGISVQYLYSRQDILINDLELALNDGDFFDAGFIEFGRSRSQAHIALARFDIWVLPFWNVYVLGGGPYTITDTEVITPEVDSQLKQPGGTVGVGTTLAYGIANFFVTADTNFAWNFMETLDGATMTWVVGLRGGYAVKFGKDRHWSFWAGAMHVAVNTDDEGSVRLGDVIESPADVAAEIERSIPGLSPADQVSAQMLADEISANLEDTVVRYRFNKELADPWTLVVGSQFQFDPHWAIRAEAGLFGRWSAMLGAQYRFGIGLPE